MACVCAAIAAAAAFQKTHLKKNREPTHNVDFLMKQSDSFSYSFQSKIKATSIIKLAKLKQH